jgi:endo-1,4-beta-xylanase
MLYKYNSSYTYLHRRCFNKVYKILQVKNYLLIIFLTGILFPTQSYSQPLAYGKSKFVGNVIHTGYNIESYFSSYWDQVTPENDGKWGSVESSPGVYNFTALDKDYNYALENGFPYKHHNLIWGSQQPTFMTDGSLDSAQEYREIVNWIDTVAQRYSKANFVDVVNEPIHTPPPYMNVLGGSGTTGWDWVINAYQLARNAFNKYAPNTKLLINEYSVINDGNANTEYLTIINLLKARGLIDGIGDQGHYFEVDGGAPLTTLKTNLDKLTVTGLPVYISELDINQQDDDTQLQRYQSIFPMLYEDPGVKGITLWGYIQGETWVPYSYLLTNRLVERPAFQWLSNYLAAYLQTNLISPVDTTGQPRNPVLVWHTSTAATLYHVQVAYDSSFEATIVDSTTADTLLHLDTLSAKTKYYWHVRAVNAGDTGSYSAAASFVTEDQIESVSNPIVVPGAYSLSQNYPNPFNPSTMIRYSIPKSEFVRLIIYNVMGQKVALLINKERPAGTYEINFNASGLACGIYFYRIEAGSYVQVKKMVLLK